MNALRRLLAGAAIALPAMALPAQAAAPAVVVSIKPIGSLVSQVMEGVGEPRVLVAGNASPHAFTMRPSDAQAVQNADLIFWMGPGFEAFLAKPLETLGGKGEAVALSEVPNAIKLPFRVGGAFEAHDHAHEGHAHGEEEEAEAGHDHDHHHDHDHAHEAAAAEDDDHDHEGGTDLHMWLDPENAKVFVGAIAEHLSEADPENAATYRANAEKAVQRLDAEEKRIAAELASVKDVPFVVFHDAYQYFDRRFGLNTVGSITVSPETAPGARRLTEIKARIADLKAACVFSEPHFEPRVVETVIEGTNARTGVLDPEGTAIEAGPNLYFVLMDGLADSLKTCLSQGS